MAIALNDLTRKEALLAELARNVTHAPERVPPPASDPALAKLNAVGTHLWLDTGNLEEASRLWRREMSALTTNNTLANQVVQTGLMDDVIQNAARQIREVEPGISLDDLVLDIVFVHLDHDLAERESSASPSAGGVEGVLRERGQRFIPGRSDLRVPGDDPRPVVRRGRDGAIQFRLRQRFAARLQQREGELFPGGHMKDDAGNGAVLPDAPLLRWPGGMAIPQGGIRRNRFNQRQQMAVAPFGALF